jgi:multidrug efflux pump subunit AcrA (membrane-fusion protein)
MKKNIVEMMFVILISGLLLSGCDLFNNTDESTPVPTPVVVSGVIAEANLVPADYVYLNFPIPGRVENILVEIGDQISVGEVMARLGQKNATALEAQILTAQMAILEAEQGLDALYESAALVAAQAQIDLVESRQALVEAERNWDAIDTDDFIEELDDARVDMIEARDDLREAEENFADHADLAEDHYLRVRYEDELEDAQAAYDEAVWAFNTLQNRYDLAATQLEAAQAALEDAQRKTDATLDAQPDPDDLALAEAYLEQARGQLRAAEYALGDIELTAPFAGQVMRVELIEGAQTSPEQIGIVLADISQWYLETNDLTENQVIDVREGRQVKITFDALPMETFTGEVESISEYYLERFGDITYLVRIRLLNEDERLRWGMTAEVNFSD